VLAREGRLTGAGGPNQQYQHRIGQFSSTRTWWAILRCVEQAPQLESGELPLIAIGDEPTHVARPTVALPLSHLLTLSLYWLGINAIWSGLHVIILPKRMDRCSAWRGGPGAGGRDHCRRHHRRHRSSHGRHHL
jgi:hypothetical protein